jgi:hypothetical protein
MARTKGSKNRPKDAIIEAPKKTGRPPKFTPEEFSEFIDAFIADCEATQSIPDDYNLIMASNGKLSPRTLDRYFSYANKDENSENNENSEKIDYTAFGNAIKKLIMYREHYNMVEAAANPKAIGHINFRIKQGRWGSWSDKQESTKDLNINIKIGDSGGDSGAKLLE